MCGSVNYIAINSGQQCEIFENEKRITKEELL